MPYSSAGSRGSASGRAAGLGRRLAGLVVDWVVCLLAVSAIVGDDVWTADGWVAIAPLLVLLVEQTLLVGLLGTAVGHRVVGVRVIRRDGRPLGLPRAALRAVLLCLAIPPLVMDADMRGLHDQAAGSVVRRSR